jgi:hypothetical protein
MPTWVMPKYYAGIGSRETPDSVLEEMVSIAHHLSKFDFILRSGGASGADTAFENGAEYSEIFVPWTGFNGRRNGVVPPLTYETQQIAAAHHPNWGACSQGARKMHIRNVCQILGQDLKTPSKFVICWTRDGKRGGGTGQALRIAETYAVPIYDLAVQDDRQRLLGFMKSL